MVAVEMRIPAKYAVILYNKNRSGSWSGFLFYLILLLNFQNPFNLILFYVRKQIPVLFTQSAGTVAHQKGIAGESNYCSGKNRNGNDEDLCLRL